MSHNTTTWGTGSNQHQFPGGNAHHGARSPSPSEEDIMEQNNFTWPRARGLDASRSLTAPPLGFDLGSLAQNLPRASPDSQSSQRPATEMNDLFFSGNGQRPISGILEGGSSSYNNEQHTGRETLPSVLENKSETSSSLLGRISNNHYNNNSYENNTGDRYDGVTNYSQNEESPHHSRYPTATNNQYSNNNYKKSTTNYNNDNDSQRHHAQEQFLSYNFEYENGGHNAAAASIVRSHSAAPPMKISHLPPGLHHQILQRPASTGVIGQAPPSPHHIQLPGGGTAVYSKTLMELIQEDFPKTPSPEFNHDGTDVAKRIVRPRSASPPRSSHFPVGDVPRTSVTMEQQDEHGKSYHVRYEHAPVAATAATSTAHPQAHALQQHQAPNVVTVVNAPQPTHVAAVPTPTTAQQPMPAAAAPTTATQYVQVPAHPGASAGQPVLIQNTTPIYHHPYDPHAALPPPPQAVPTVYYTQHPPPSEQVYAVTAANAGPFYAVPAYAAGAHHPSARHHVLHHHPAEYISVVPVAAAHEYYYRGGAHGVAETHQGGHGRRGNKGKEPGRGGGGRGGKHKGNKQQNQHICHKGSAVLEEFRAKGKDRNWTVEDIQGHIVEFCLDQNGSRFIQQRLEVALPSEKQLVLAEILPTIQTLRNDVFGNYVVQKLLEHGTPPTKTLLRQTLTGEMYNLSLQMYGCRVVQKALETLQDPSLLFEFHPHVVSLIHDQNGNHVMQKCIEVFSHDPSKIQFILDDVLKDVSGLSRHPYGCRVMQRILEHCDNEQKTAALDAVAAVHKSLLDDQYGNYVIQHVLRFGRKSDRDSILSIILSSGVLILSRQKFASNVLEKLLKHGSQDQRRVLVREMLNVIPGEEGGETSVVLLMVKDAYANYVVQTMLDVLEEGEERKMLLEELNANAVQLRNYTFAKHIVAKLN
eukprot:CAMPEP_0172496956 /NCGR_PEP_ID=MMETSP1066-20121228/94710_1 /TAXON_ID=671091 /ORGANISM="Coscinodiscus wailesii, Strain CCMP2513" /LENGTH=922 /DNA_ID=CAMNT_0013269513 /DNA_START=354 /DNA_END=3122 /DNA_ORIENTATION=-